MTLRFLDANIFLRHLVQGDERKAAKCFDLFRRLGANDETAATSESVIAEVVYVLVSKRQYGLARGEIAARLRPILELRGLQVQNRDMYLRALDLYRDHPFDFVDALTIAHMEYDAIAVLYSYDRDFDRIDTVRRAEPP